MCRGSTRIAQAASSKPATKVDGPLLRQALLGSLSWLGQHQEEINRLNVFPVPDGDTGTNMLLTLRAALEDIQETEVAEVGRIARITAHGSLMGARGNSGVILSQIFRGFAKAVEGKSVLTPSELANAFEEAANAAYRAVPKPTEGTILTVAREAGRAAQAAAEKPGANVVDVIEGAARGAREATDRTPTQLQVLREAGVVDAGGFGLQIMLEGMLKTVEDTAELLISSPNAAAAAQASMELPEEGWGYCTEFLIQGQKLDVEDIREKILALGNSVLVVGEPELVKVHVHTDDPGRVIALASSLGKLDRLNVGDMSSQHRKLLEEGVAGANGTADYEAAGPARANGVGLVAVVAGDGLVRIFRGLGADAIVEGGQSMNPSLQDLLKAVEQAPYDEVVLLPNNKNVILAAREVDNQTKKRVHLLDTATVPQGIAALVAFNSERDAGANLRSMGEAATHVQTIEVTHAVRATTANGVRVKKGDVIALINDKLEQAGSSYGEVVSKALEQVGAEKYELVTVYCGSQAVDGDSDRLSETIRQKFPKLEVDVQTGGQDLYPFILSVE